MFKWFWTTFSLGAPVLKDLRWLPGKQQLYFRLAQF